MVLPSLHSRQVAGATGITRSTTPSKTCTFQQRNKSCRARVRSSAQPGAGAPNQPELSSSAPPQQQQEQDQQYQRSGPTGLNVGKYRPTSPAGWAEMAAALRKANVRVLAPQELPWLAEKGAVLLDIRPQESFDQGHLPGSAHVAFYQPIQGWTPWQVARRAGYALFGISQGTEANPNFLAEVRQKVSDPATTPVVLYCNLGGSLEPTKNDRNGQQTRSMIAAYELVQGGFRNVSVLKGGYLEWVAADREIEVFE